MLKVANFSEKLELKYDKYVAIYVVIENNRNWSGF